MTSDELNDLRSMADSMRRIERKVDEQAVRVDRLEKFADRAEGAITLAKWAFSFLGIGGVAAVIAVLTRGQL